MIRPQKSRITTSDIAAYIRENNGLPIQPESRITLEGFLENARENSDIQGIAYVAFSLAYSFDRYKPYGRGQAIELLSGVLLLFPKWPEAYLNRGIAYAHSKNYREAIQNLERADELYGELLNNNRDNNQREGQDTSSSVNITRKITTQIYIADNLRCIGGMGALRRAESILLHAEKELVHHRDEISSKDKELDERFEGLHCDIRERLNLSTSEDREKVVNVAKASLRTRLLGILCAVLALFWAWWLIDGSAQEELQQPAGEVFSCVNTPKEPQSEQVVLDPAKSNGADSTSNPAQELEKVMP